MAYCSGFRFISQQQLTTSILRGLRAPQVRVFSLKAVPAVEQTTTESYDERNARLKRPQSPHLTIYKPQLTTMLSITHRGTGLMMGGIMTAFGIGGLVLSKEFSEYFTQLQDMHLSPILLTAAKLGLAFPFCYHYCNGIRHLLWDTGCFLNIKQVYATGYAMVVCSIVMTLALVFAL